MCSKHRRKCEIFVESRSITHVKLLDSLNVAAQVMLFLNLGGHSGSTIEIEEEEFSYSQLVKLLDCFFSVWSAVLF